MGKDIKKLKKQAKFHVKLNHSWFLFCLLKIFCKFVTLSKYIYYPTCSRGKQQLTRVTVNKTHLFCIISFNLRGSW